MAKSEPTLPEVYEECLKALYDQENSLERLWSSLDRIGVEKEASRADFERLIERNRMTRRAVNLLRTTSGNELEQLRFKRDQLLEELGKISTSSTQSDETEGSEPTVSPGIAAAVALRFLADTVIDRRLSIEDRFAACRILLGSQEVQSDG